MQLLTTAASSWTARERDVGNFLKCDYSGRSNHLTQNSKNGDGIGKKLQDEATYDCVEGLSALHLRSVAFNESYVGQSRVSNPRPSSSNRARVAFDSHYLARRTNQLRCQHSDIADTGADIQDTLARSDACFTEKSLGTGR
jgi:hypothetical protein